MDEEGQTDRRGWHVGKEVPIALLAGLLVQTLVFVWWLSGLAAEVSSTVRKVDALTSRVEQMQITFAQSNTSTAVGQTRIGTLEAEVSVLRAAVSDLQRRQAMDDRRGDR